MRLALAQINPAVGDIKGNIAKIKRYYNQAVTAGAELIMFPELFVCGYPPEDLLHKHHFLQDNFSAVEQIAKACEKAVVIVGFAELDNGMCYNSAAIIRNGRIEKIYRKGLLPNYGVFDEGRYFEAGSQPLVIQVGDIKVAITICRDIWDINWLSKFLKPVEPFDFLANISSSPFHIGKNRLRQRIVTAAAHQFKCGICYCNSIGGQDELIFDGRSMILDSCGKIITRAKAFEEDLLIADVTGRNGSVKAQPVSPVADECEEAIDEVYKALVLGTKDYVTKNGFTKILIGLSGGIDSSVVAAIAVAALGKDAVIGITMPSRFNSSETKSDAAKLAENLDIEFKTVPIQDTLDAFDNMLKPIDGWDNKGIAYENLQARIRGSILMSLSNQFGAMVLTTGNKSETAVGYSTLYGDTAGGFAVIKDVPKTLVYKIAEYINEKAGTDIIPKAVIERPPSAELRDNQKDTDSLPDYSLLDQILEEYIENDKSPQQLFKIFKNEDEILKVVRLVDRNEYKRRQSPPGIKITSKAFGRDRRLPITNKYLPH